MVGLLQLLLKIANQLLRLLSLQQLLLREGGREGGEEGRVLRKEGKESRGKKGGESTEADAAACVHPEAVTW